ncbi:hypothetical protein BDV93DRAFT_609737 [Ceratobasidium sp. AG-I]|nr:hypothetical protein BDV93DRAFT_609737 [Ceratobasidium sp. AG-I]
MSEVKRRSPTSDQAKMDEVLSLLKQFKWSLGRFLWLLFTDFSYTKEFKNGEIKRRTQRHTNFVSKFLSTTPQNSSYGIQSILSAIYDHADSVPARYRATESRPAPPSDDHRPLARHQLLLWAFGAQDWESIVEFSLTTLRNYVKTTAPFLYALLVRAATSAHLGSSGFPLDGSRDRDPRIIAIVSILMIVVCRNVRANFFQKVMGVWLFSCSAPVHIYRICSRLGLSVGYTTVLQTLKNLANSSILSTRMLAKELQFLVIFDNINRKRKFWTPQLGQQDILMSGTASTLVELSLYDSGAFDLQPVLSARQNQARKSLTTDVLWKQVDQQHLNSVMALHCLNFLVSNCPALSGLSDYITEQLRTTYAIHRMPNGAKTKAHPLSSSSISEDSAEGCRDTIDEILLHQLGLPPELVKSALIIVGGDLGTIEKVRALKTLASSCGHGYNKYEWVLPLVQLWHMGWADLARLISTYWGKPASLDPSSLWHACSLLGRKVKPEDRPEYYPAQALVFDTLEADVLDCWRLILDTEDLDGYFSAQPSTPDGSELFKIARQLVSQWASTRAHMTAMRSSDHWTGPIAGSSCDITQKTSQSDSEDSDTPLASSSRIRQSVQAPRAGSTPSKGFRGDHVLANSILRLRDSLWHYEFIWAIADGDIGRAMKIMSVWQFTFAGSSAKKYATELLELACGFLFEFPEPLQLAIKNNWVCNFSSLPGCWFPMDLMQEHNIRELKDKSQRRDEDFEGEFFQKVVSRNIRWFTRVQSAVNKSVGLKNRSATHGHQRRADAATRLRTSLTTERVHTFIPGRSYDWTARDNLAIGYNSMPDKISRFLSRTTSDPGAHGFDDDEIEEGEAGVPMQESFDVQLPPMVDGTRLVIDEAEDDLSNEEILAMAKESDGY